MVRIGSLYFAISFLALCAFSVFAQNDQEAPAPPPPPPEAGHPEGGAPRHFGPPDPNAPGKRERGDRDPGKRGDNMGRFGFGPGMGGPQFEKMVELALGPQENLEQALEKWQPLKDKGPEARNRFLKQIENFRVFLKNQAFREAEMLGLKIKPEQQDQFVRDYWKKRLEVDHTLRKEMEPRRRELTDKMNEELRKQFGS